jgi:hypothetical protein
MASATSVQTYENVVNASATSDVRVFRAGSLSYLVRVGTLCEFDETVAEAARLQAAHVNPKGCRTCMERAVKYAPLVGPDGPVFLECVKPNCCDPATVAVRELAVKATANCGHRVVYPFVVTTASFGPRDVGGFPHWTVTPESATTHRARLFERAAEVDYVDMEGGTMLTGLVATLLLGPAMVDSMNLFSECLEKTSRGESLYRATTDWMVGVQEYARDTFPGRFWDSLASDERLHAVMFALGTSNLASGEKNASVCTNYHQANGSVLGFLQNAHDLDSMVGLVNAQTDPYKYQRRTAELSAGALAVGAAKLGEFTNTLCTHSQLFSLYPKQYVTWVTPSPPDPASSSTGYAAMRAALDEKAQSGKKAQSNLSGKVLKASEFAFRAGATPGGPAITTVAELLVKLSDGKPHTLTVDAATHEPWVVVNTTLAAEKLRPCQKHVWACYKHRSASAWGGTATTSVRALFRMPMGEVMFVCDGFKPFNLGNCNFPEFLGLDMHSAKAVFEALNQTTSMEVPTLAPGDNYAAGVCATPQTAQRTLYKPLALVLDGVKHTLMRFGE